MSFYPVFLELGGKVVLVVGGGRVAQRKIESLLTFGALIRIISKDITEKLKVLTETGKVELIDDNFQEGYLDGTFLVIAATDNPELNRQVSLSARRRGLLVNVVDQPADCNFIVPALVKKGDLLIAVSTSGKSPALAKEIRKQLEIQFGGEYSTFLILMGRLRKEILSKGYSQDENTRIFKNLIDSKVLRYMARGDWEGVKSSLELSLPDDLAINEVLEGIEPR